MKKLLIITLQPGLVKGNVIKRDITDQPIAPIGANANDAAYATFCLKICQLGYNHPDTDAKRYIHISPSQIKTVEIKFEA